MNNLRLNTLNKIFLTDEEFNNLNKTKIVKFKNYRISAYRRIKAECKIMAYAYYYKSLDFLKKYLKLTRDYLKQTFFNPFFTFFTKYYLNYKLKKLCKLDLHFKYSGVTIIIKLKFCKYKRRTEVSFWLDNMDLEIMRDNNKLGASQNILWLYDSIAFYFIENTHYLTHININRNKILRYHIEETSCNKYCFFKFRYYYLYKTHFKFIHNILEKINIAVSVHLLRKF